MRHSIGLAHAIDEIESVGLPPSVFKFWLVTDKIGRDAADGERFLTLERAQVRLLGIAERNPGVSYLIAEVIQHIAWPNFRRAGNTENHAISQLCEEE